VVDSPVLKQISFEGYDDINIKEAWLIYDHALALTTKDELYGWGSNED